MEYLLDRIHDGDQDGEVSYLISRLRAGEAPDAANAAASALIRRSFGAYRAARTNAATVQAFAAKVAVLDGVLAADAVGGITEAARVSAFTGLPAPALASALARLADPAVFPTTIMGWVDWIINFLRDDAPARLALFEGDDSVMRAVARGKKTGGNLTEAEFQVLRAGLHAWMSGRPFQDIEAALGVDEAKIRCCGRARDLVLKIVNRRLYMIASAIAELAKARYAETAIVESYPAILESLAYAIRSGFDTPEKVAFSHLNPRIRTRVATHRASQAQIGAVEQVVGARFRDVLQEVKATLAFADVDV